MTTPEKQDLQLVDDHDAPQSSEPTDRSVQLPPPEQPQPVAPTRPYKKIMPDLITVSRAFGSRKLTPDKEDQRG
jgi:hypothetical protein